MQVLDTPEETVDSPNFNWSSDAPRGGKTVMNRILKENATVPLFFAQTLISSLRDVGYNDTTSALCEHVDNAIEAGANEIRVYFRQIGKKGNYEIDAAVYDNGRGMAPNVLKVATAFGGSMNFNNRGGIGRFGMGMKTAALSMSPVMDLYSWQEKNAIYNMTLDVNDIGLQRSNVIELPEAELMTGGIPNELIELFIKPMVYPKDHNVQELLARTEDEFRNHLGNSGTIVYMPNCDRLSSRTAQPLADHATKEMARIYRRFLDRSVKIYVNNKLLEAFDPTYSMSSARHNKLDIPVRQSRLIISKIINIAIKEQEYETAPITIKLYKLPIEEWDALPLKVKKNDLRVFDGSSLSVLRNDREVSTNIPGILHRNSISNWLRLQIDFSGQLDEAFGVATNKQGVRVKKYVINAIKTAIHEEIKNTYNELKRFQSEKGNARTAVQQSQSELKASEADIYQAKPLDDNLTLDEQAQMDENLKGLAAVLTRDGESDESAFERIKNSKYIITFKHDIYWPFYDVQHKFGKIILTINTAHAFYTKLYEPIARKKIANETEGDEILEGVDEVDAQDDGERPIQALELLLLSLARTQSILVRDSEEHRKLFDTFCREWSDSYRIQLGE